MKELTAFSLSDVVFIMLINAKIEIVGILTFMSRINFALNWDEHEKSLIISGPDLEVIKPFSYATQLSTKFPLHIKGKMLGEKIFFLALNFSDVVFVLLLC